MLDFASFLEHVCDPLSHPQNGIVSIHTDPLGQVLMARCLDGYQPVPRFALYYICFRGNWYDVHDRTHENVVTSLPPCVRKYCVS